jgi:hypothetical protein
VRAATLALALVLLPPALTSTASAQRSNRSSAADSVGAWIRNAEREAGIDLPAASDVRSGDQIIVAGEALGGDLVTVRGNIRVAGAVDGDVVALGGDVVVEPGARVTGSVVAAGGAVRIEGGLVEGEVVETVLLAAEAAPPVRRSPIGLALGWASVLAAIGVVALILARRNLERVAEAVRVRFGRSLLFGLVGQLAFFPALLAIVVVLAITIIGLLVIPIALVAFLTAVAGAATLGFLAVAFASGQSLAARLRGSRTAPAALALLVGLGVYVLAWIAAAALTEVPVAGAALRALVGLVTWVALTVGFGATILTRGGSRDAVPEPDEPAVMPDDMWQTPTPVSGVTAARRPTPAPRSYHP